MRVGYARVSTIEQELTLQTKALTEAGCEKIFTDKASGGSKDRQGLDEILEYLRPGDALVVWKLDRLGRSVKHLIELSEELKKREIDLVSITEGVDTQTPVGRFYFTIIGAFAELEREVIRERTKAGLSVARQAGRIGGRKPVMTEAKKEAAKRLLASEMPVPDVATSIGVSVATLYRHFPATER